MIADKQQASVVSQGSFMEPTIAATAGLTLRVKHLRGTTECR